MEETIPEGEAVSLGNDVVLGALLGRRIRVFPEGAGVAKTFPWVVLSEGGGDWILDEHDPQRYREQVAAFLGSLKSVERDAFREYLIHVVLQPFEPEF